jgi:hypothetical protein
LEALLRDARSVLRRVDTLPIAALKPANLQATIHKVHYRA